MKISMIRPVWKRTVYLLAMAIALICLALLASCGGDDPVVPVIVNHAPTAPVINTTAGAPADGATNVALSAVLHWSCTDTDGDPLTYAVHFGTVAEPPVVAEGLATASYTPAALVNGTTYYWQIVASDDGAESTDSPVWSFTTVASTVDTISVPDAPSGPITGLENEDLEYLALGSVSAQGHDVEYRFDWGDGQYSAWGTTGVQYSWATAGSYDILAQARCIEHTAIVSDWSLATTVIISTYGAETVTAPVTPSGSATGETGQSISYTTSGAASSGGHPVEYSFDWGNGITSTWSTIANRSYTWGAAGTYLVKAQA